MKKPAQQEVFDLLCEVLRRKGHYDIRSPGVLSVGVSEEDMRAMADAVVEMLEGIDR